MSTWILIVMLSGVPMTGGGRAITSVVFNTKEACESAIVQIKAQSYSGYLVATCVENPPAEKQ